MSSERPESLKPHVDVPGQVAGDVPCIHCGYDLRTLKTGGVCPECGQAVTESLRCYGKDSVEWLGRVADAATSAAAVLVIELVLIALSISPVSRVSDVGCVFATMVVLAGTFLFLTMVSMTVQDPVQTHREGGASARRVVRVCLALLLISVAAFGVLIASIPFGQGWGWAAGVAVSVVCTSFAVLPPAMAAYLAVLMERIARPSLAKASRWFLVASVVLEAVAAGVFALDLARVWRRWPQGLIESLLAFLMLGLLAGACVLLICVARALRAAYQQAKERLELLERAEDAKAADVLFRAAAGSEQVAGEGTLPP